jgi:predicted SAM-dependent methyltransferase
MAIAPHQQPAVALLRGVGVEVGALNRPFPVLPGTQVSYLDVITPERAKELFPEIDPAGLVQVDRLIDMDTDGLGYLGDRALDFVIMTHVIEHLANPVKAIEESFRVLAIGGRLLIGVPDRDFTFDRLRDTTPFGHLWDDYMNGVTASSDAHYLDYFKSAGPHHLLEPAERLSRSLRWARDRREHSHVWTSETFRDFLVRTLDLLGYKAEPAYESLSADNKFEYFGVWTRLQ